MSLTPLHTTHIQQELWTYKTDKAFSMTPTEAIITLYYDDLRQQGISSNQEINSYQPYDIKLRNKVNFDIQPTNPQADIVATGCCKYWITDVDLMKHQGNDTESPSDDPILSEVYTATVACNLQQTVYAKACSPLSASTFYKGLLKRQNTAAYMTAFTRPP
jgi:hypothetical protein